MTLTTVGFCVSVRRTILYEIIKYKQKPHINIRLQYIYIYIYIYILYILYNSDSALMLINYEKKENKRQNKSQGTIPKFNKIIATTHTHMRTGLYMPVSYTHLDVYKRQRKYQITRSLKM